MPSSPKTPFPRPDPSRSRITRRPDDHDDRAGDAHPGGSGAVLTYDVRKVDSPAPVLFIIGSPMGAGGFVTLASHFPDRTVVTYDPRGVERSTKVDPTSASTPEQHADDLHRIIAEIGEGPVDLFASSGGAVNALALVAKTQRMSGPSWRMSRRWPPSCPTATARWHSPRRSRTRTSVVDSVRGWRSSSSPSATRGRSPRTSPRSRRPIPRCSACRPSTTAHERTRSCSRTSSPAPITSRTSMRSEPPPRASCSAPASSPTARCPPRRRGGRRATRHRARGLPERARRLPWRRVRPNRRTRCLRREAPRGPHPRLIVP